MHQGKPINTNEKHKTNHADTNGDLNIRSWGRKEGGGAKDYFEEGGGVFFFFSNWFLFFWGMHAEAVRCFFLDKAVWCIFSHQASPT